MTARQIKRWKIVDVVTRGGRTEVLVCASPKATNHDLVAFARAYTPSRALHPEWTVVRSGLRTITRCGLVRGFRHYTLLNTERTPS